MSTENKLLPNTQSQSQYPIHRYPHWVRYSLVSKHSLSILISQIRTSQMQVQILAKIQMFKFWQTNAKSRFKYYSTVSGYRVLSKEPLAQCDSQIWVCTAKQRNQPSVLRKDEEDTKSEFSCKSKVFLRQAIWCPDCPPPVFVMNFCCAIYNWLQPTYKSCYCALKFILLITL